MTRSISSRHWVHSLLVMVSAGLTACGGGGGSGSGGGSNPPAPAPATLGYTLSRKTIVAQVPVTGLAPDDVLIDVTISDTVAGQFGMGGVYAGDALGFGLYESTGATSGRLRLAFKPPSMLRPGVYHDSVTVGFCPDQACDGQKVTRTSTIDVTYTVLTATMPTVTLSTDTVNAAALAGDAAPVAPIVINATINNPSAYPFGGGGNATHNGVYSASYVPSGTTSGTLTVVLKTPNTLPAGTYTDTIDMRLCLDLDCLNPVAVTPARITVNYTISDSVPGPNGYDFKLLPAIARDIAWNGAGGVMYLAVPSTAAEHANSVVEFDPANETYGASVSAGNNPYLLELSDDGSRLYAAGGAGTSVHRFTTAPLAADLDIDLGTNAANPSGPPYVVQNMQPAPGHPEVLAVRRDDADRDIAIFDDMVRRPNVVAAINPPLTHLVWDPDGAHVYTSAAVLAVDAQGVSASFTRPENLTGRIHYAPGQLISDWGQVVDLASGTTTSIGLDGYPNVGTVDIGAGRIYFLTASRADIGKYQVETYDMNTRTRIGIGPLPKYNEFLSPIRLVRWGADGLAAVSRQNRVIIVRGALVVP